MRIDNISPWYPASFRQIQARQGCGVGEDWSSNLDQMTWLLFGSNGWPLFAVRLPLFSNFVTC